MTCNERQDADCVADLCRKAKDGQHDWHMERNTIKTCAKCDEMRDAETNRVIRPWATKARIR